MAHLDPTLETVLREAISRHSLDDHFAAIRSRARATILLQVSAVENDEPVPVGASHFGGTPDLPPGIAWPQNPADNLLLDFVGQVNLSDLPDVGQSLPRDGLLLMFSQQDSTSDNPHAICFVPSTNSLATAEVPTSESFSDEDTDEPFGIVLVTGFLPSVSLPNSAAFPNFDDEFHDAYSELLTELHNDPTQKEPTSRLLGYPAPYGSPLPNDNWELLAEVESHFANGRCYMNFWDAGRLQLMAPKSQLHSCNFSESVAAIISM